MKNRNIKKRTKRRPNLFKLGASSLEIMPIPEHVKRAAKGRKITILDQPFKMGFTDATDWECAENSELYIVSQNLTSQQLSLIKQTVGSYSMNHIKAFLMRVYNLHEVKELKWPEILSYMEEYLHSHSQKNRLSGSETVEKKEEDLTDTEQNIIEALHELLEQGIEDIRQKELLQKANYSNSSHYRQILSNLKKRKILNYTKKKGYYL